jgi:ATP-dependent RNA helicase SUPV3L1/SUV3
MADGSFGTTAEIGPLEPAVIDAIENHRFPSLTAAFWRNAELEFRTPAALLASLEARPPDPALIRARHADDHLVLQALARDGDVAALADRASRVRLLWDCCQIPDFRKVLDEAHARLVKRIFLFVAGPAGRLPGEWIARQVERLDRTEGDIDSLLQRISHIRTWTYVAQRAGWLDDPKAWQERTRAIEDKLSDALHERLTQRFVDRRSATAARCSRACANRARSWSRASASAPSRASPSAPIPGSSRRAAARCSPPPTARCARTSARASTGSRARATTPSRSTPTAR